MPRQFISDEARGPSARADVSGAAAAKVSAIAVNRGLITAPRCTLQCSNRGEDGERKSSVNNRYRQTELSSISKSFFLQALRTVSVAMRRGIPGTIDIDL